MVLMAYIKKHLNKKELTMTEQAESQTILILEHGQHPGTTAPGNGIALNKIGDIP